MVTSMVADDEGLLSIQEAANYLKVSYKTVYRMVTRGKLEARRVGVQWRIPRRELKRDIEPSGYHYEKSERKVSRADEDYNEDSQASRPESF